MKFRKDYFEELNGNVDDVVYVAYKSNLKSKGFGYIMLKLLGFHDFLLHNVLYLPDL